MILTRDKTFQVVCEIRTIIGNEVTVGTGMFVTSPINNAERWWIVTASHIANSTNNNTEIVLATGVGTARSIPLKVFGSVRNWRTHPVADISVFPIAISNESISLLRGRLFPLDHFNLSHQSVSRDYELTCVGFPNGLGVDGSFSPFTFRSYATSGFVTLLRADTRTPSEFFCLENPSVGGYSGGPVFDLGYSTNGLMTMTKEKTWCHGIIHGTMMDNTGGKIAMVTPAFYLSDLIGD